MAVNRFEVIPETVGQFTGLCDKSGKKIFEGDIVEFECHGYIHIIEKGVVELIGGCYCIKWHDDWGFTKVHRMGSIEKWDEMGSSGTAPFTYEIIGNKRDNPDCY